mmetsp:Transcript_37794/g.90789  ORF Transcript_37794/g.90789 Transcript_37794/m.90789 type:complete len:350 (-) Transcript_37794:57-1106(-)
MSLDATPAVRAAPVIGGVTVLPFVEKYRPAALSDLVAHEDIVKTVRKFVDEKTLPHLLFHGPAGTGKTSTMVACAKEMFGKQYRHFVLELNASDARGIDVVRNQIIGFASTTSIVSSPHPKLIILDEADNMTSAAQFALRRVIEKYSKVARFCLICNYANKIIPALQSRCTRFRFGPLSESEMEGRLREIVEKEGIKVTDCGVRAMLSTAKGDMRKVLNILQACSMGNSVVDEAAVYSTTGKPLPADVQAMLRALTLCTYRDGYDQIQELMTQKGYSITDLLLELHDVLVGIEMPPATQDALWAAIADMDYRCAAGGAESSQLMSLVGAFHQARFQMEGLILSKEQSAQ